MYQTAQERGTRYKLTENWNKHTDDKSTGMMARDQDNLFC